MGERNYEIPDEGSLHPYRTEIPNTVVRGVMGQKLSIHAKWLYVYLKSVCGDKAISWRGTSMIAKESGLSRTMVSTGKKELITAGLIVIQKGKNPHRDADHIRIKDIWLQNMQEFSILLANTKENAESIENQEDRHESIPLENTKHEECSISEHQCSISERSVLLANQRRSQEEDPKKKKKDSLTTFESWSDEESTLPASDIAAAPSTAIQGKVARKNQAAKVVERIPDDHWLRALLWEYEGDLDLDALDDWEWWSTFAKTFPDDVFKKGFVRSALANMAGWLNDNPRRRPRVAHKWRERAKISFNFYYDKFYSRRVNGQGHRQSTETATANFVAAGGK